MNKRKKQPKSQVTPKAEIEFKPILLLVVIIWVVAVYSSSIHGVFILDDRTLTEDKALTNLWSTDWFRITQRPFTTFTFAINFSLFGVEPLSCHLVNIAIHLVATASLYYLCKRSADILFPDTKEDLRVFFGLATALLWSLHPLCTSSVTYIVQRGESMASMFMLLCLVCWTRAFGSDDSSPSPGRKWIWALAAISAAYLAYGSKQMAAGLPIIVLLFDRFVLLKSWKSVASRIGWYVLLLVPLVIGATLILPGLLTAKANATAGFELKGMTPWSYFTTQPLVLLQYLKLTLLPYPQSLDYGWIPFKDSTYQVLGVLGWVVLFVGCCLVWRKSRAAAVSIIAAFLVLAPTSTVMPLQDIIFEHRMYLPLALLLAPLLAVFSGLANRATDIPQWKIVTVVAVACGFSWISVNRNLDYDSEEQLIQHDLTYNPDNPRLYRAFAGTLPDDQVDQKIENLKKAIQLSEARNYFYAGTDYKWRRELADLYFFTNQIEPSIPLYEKAGELAYTPLQSTEIDFQMAMIASIQGRNEDAEELFQRALQGHKQIRDQIEKVYNAHRQRINASSKIETPSK